MKKLDLFLAAMNAELYRKRAWVISVFALTNEASEDWKKDPYPYRIVQTPTSFFFVDPTDVSKLVMIEDSVIGVPLFNVAEPVDLEPGMVTNLTKGKAETSYGNVLLNYAMLVYAFGKKIEFLPGKIKPTQLENLVIEKLKDNVPVEERNESDIYVDEYLKFCDAAFYLTAFTQICVPSASAKTLVAAPGIIEFRKKLIEENKDRLQDPVVVAKIDAALVEYDKAYMKGDIGEDFLIGGKAYAVVRKKLYGMHGAETGLEEKIDVDLIQNSLSEGWDISKFPAMNNSLRAGSFNRGAQTMLGGESVKWLLRGSSNISVTIDDCGSVMGVKRFIDQLNFEKYIGFSIVEEGATKLLTKENVNGYMNKEVSVRSPMFCKLTKTDFCKCCVGSRLAASPTGLSTAISEYGSSFLAIFLALSHGKALQLAKMDYKKQLF
jgi:hypothetical protein